jgi:hypothetical protein
LQDGNHNDILAKILAYLTQEGLLPVDGRFQLTPLIGGFWNDVYHLQGNGRNWVIKHSRTANPDGAASPPGLYPILPHAEALALQTLSGLNIAPDHVAFLSEVPLLIYEFFAGNVWQEDGVAVGRLLRRLHDVPVSSDSGFRYLPLETADILQQGDHILSQAEPNASVQHLRTLRPVPQPRPPLSRLALVHTDAWVGNFVQNGRSLRLIDWQSPGLGDPAEDVWTFLYTGYEMLLGRPRFDEAVQAEFWQGYGLDTPVSHYLPLLGPYYAYRLAAHCCLRHQQLAATNPTASHTYQKLFTLHIRTLT